MADTDPTESLEWTQAAPDTAALTLHGQAESGVSLQGEYGWLVQQADLLRTGHLDALDQQPLADLLIDMAISEARALGSALRILLQHML